MSSRTKRVTLAVAAVSVGTLGLSACGGGGFSSGTSTATSAASASGPVKLTVMIGSSGDAETAAVKAATEAWAKKSGAHSAERRNT